MHDPTVGQHDLGRVRRRTGYEVDPDLPVGQPPMMRRTPAEPAHQTSGWHTVTNANTPSSSTSIAEVQAYD